MLGLKNSESTPGQSIGGTAQRAPVAPASFAARLKRLRKAAGLSQTDLAGDDLSPSYISLLESGKRSPSGAVVAQLAVRLGCSEAMLWEGEHSERERRLTLELSYARLALNHGGMVDAKERLVALLQEPGLDQHRRDEGTLLLGTALERSGEFDRAIETLNPLFTRSLRGQSHLPVSSIGDKLCSCYIEVGDVNQGVVVGRAAMDAAAENGLGGTEEYFRLGAVLLWAHHELGNLSHAVQWARQLIAEAEEAGTSAGAAAIYWNAALLADSMGEVSEALHLSERALARIGESGDSRDLVRLHLSMADIQLHLDPPPTEQILVMLTRLQDQLGDLGGQIELTDWHAMTATCHALLGDLAAAREHARAALEAAISLGEHEFTVHAHLVSGDVAMAGGQGDEAVTHYLTAVDVVNRLAPRRTLVRLWRDLGDRLYELGRYANAAECFERALTTARIPDRSAALRAGIRAAQATSPTAEV